MYTLFLLTNITFDIDQNVKRHSMNSASQNTVIGYEPADLTVHPPPPE